MTAAQEGMLWGSLVSDALAMPAHWYYQRDAIIRDYGVVGDYRTPTNPHPDSILWRSHYKPLNDRGGMRTVGPLRGLAGGHCPSDLLQLHQVRKRTGGEGLHLCGLGRR